MSVRILRAIGKSNLAIPRFVKRSAQVVFATAITVAAVLALVMGNSGFMP
jgi:hypothetical protein